MSICIAKPVYIFHFNNFYTLKIGKNIVSINEDKVVYMRIKKEII